MRVVLATAWSLARVYCGVHYPLDVVVGAAVGAFAAYLIAQHWISSMTG